MTTQLPDDKHLTIGWLIEHFPVRWWVAIGIFILGTLSLGYGVGSFFAADVGAVSAKELIRLEDEKAQLRKDILALQQERSSLEAEIAALKIDRRVSSMTDEEIRKELKGKWTRE